MHPRARTSLGAPRPSCRSARPFARLHAPLLVACALHLVACIGDAPPDIVLVTIDTLRADSLGAYGNAAARTPHLDGVARAGVLYEAAIAPLPETRPAHFSLFTARLPSQHGSLSNTTPLREEALTLAEVLESADYDTAGFVGCVLLDGDSGAQQGFATFGSGDGLMRPAREVIAEARRWLTRRRHRPLFLWVHLFDPHMPYAPPSPFDSPAPGQPAMITAPWLEEVASANEGDVPAAVLDRARLLYQGEVESVDHELGALLSELEGRPRPPLLAVVSDHGECFSNGTYFDHSGCLYEEAIRVPLLLHWPGRLPAGARMADVVAAPRLAPTLLRLAELEIPAAMEAPALPLPGDAPAEARPAFFQLPLYAPRDLVLRTRLAGIIRTVAGRPTRLPSDVAPQMGARRGSWVYLRRGGQEELYALARDPGQSVNVAREHPARLRRLRRASREWLRRQPPLPPAQDAAPEMLEKLKSLGYL